MVVALEEMMNSRLETAYPGKRQQRNSKAEERGKAVAGARAGPHCVQSTRSS